MPVRGDTSQLHASFDVSDWSPWFAWHPVHSYDGHRLWLRMIDRRCISIYSYIDGSFRNEWQYRLYCSSSHDD